MNCSDYLRYNINKKLENKLVIGHLQILIFLAMEWCQMVTLLFIYPRLQKKT